MKVHQPERLYRQDSDAFEKVAKINTYWIIFIIISSLKFHLFDSSRHYGNDMTGGGRVAKISPIIHEYGRDVNGNLHERNPFGDHDRPGHAVPGEAPVWKPLSLLSYTSGDVGGISAHGDPSPRFVFPAHRLTGRRPLTA